MKITIDIPEKVLRETMRHTGARSRKAAVLAAISDFNRCRRLKKLATRFGTFEHFYSRQELMHLRGEHCVATDTGVGSDG